MNIGVYIFNPLLISIGILMSLPANLIIDYFIINYNICPI